MRFMKASSFSSKQEGFSRKNEFGRVNKKEYEREGNDTKTRR